MRVKKVEKTISSQFIETIIYTKLELLARSMREKPTKAEAALWHELRNRKLGVKFRQQHVINRFIVDFCCLKANLVIEVDGNIHYKQKMQDRIRTEILETEGYRVLRFSNKRVFNDLDSVLKEIKELLK